MCYRTICSEAPARLGEHNHPEISMHTPPFAAYVRHLQAGDWPAVAELMIESAQKLASVGADFLVCPDNTIHHALPLLEARSPLPWLHIAGEVARQAAARGHQKVGLTGTRWLVESEVYPKKLAERGIAFLRPGPDDRQAIDRIIMQQLVYGIFKPEAISCFQSVISGFKDAGCDAVVLGCTEIPLIINDGNSPLPVLDSTRILARAALGHAIGGRES